MPIRSWITSLALLLLIAPAATWAGDNPHVRDRFVLGLNLGGGSAKAKFETDEFQVEDEDRLGGVAASFRFAVAVSPTVMMGLESSAWGREETISTAGEDPTVTTTLSVLAFGVSWFPNQGGFFVRGGVGLGIYDESAEIGNLTIQYDETDRKSVV